MIATSKLSRALTCGKMSPGLFCVFAFVAAGLAFRFSGDLFAEEPSPKPVVAEAAGATPDAAEKSTSANAPSASPEKPEAPPAPTFSPEIEKKIATVLAATKAAKISSWRSCLKRRMDAVAQEIHLPPELARALVAGLDPAIEQSIAGWQVALEASFRKLVESQKDRLAEGLEQLDEDSRLLAMEAFPDKPAAYPLDQPAWTQTLEKTLDAEQLTVWKKVNAAREAEEQQRIKKVLALTLRNMERIFKQHVEQQVTHIKILLSPSALQTQKLSEFATACETAARQRVAENLTDYVRFQDLDRMSRIDSFNVSLDPNDLPDRLPAWKQGLAKILSTDELHQLELDQQSRQDRAFQARVKITVATLDQNVAFSESQREALIRIVSQIKTFAKLPRDVDLTDRSAESVEFHFRLKELAELNLAVRPLLDSFQWSRWQEAIAGQTSNPYGAVETVEKSGNDEASLDVEAAISDFVEAQVDRAKDTIRNECKTVAEDCVRLAKPSPEVAERLRTAALGSSERLIADFRENCTRQVRGYLPDSTPETIRENLKAIPDYWLRMNESPRATEPKPIFDHVVETELSAGQRATWKKELDARKSFLCEALAGHILVAFEREIPLSSENSQKLQACTEKVLADYEELLAQGPENLIRNSYYVLLPVAGVPTKELQSCLTPAQLDAWEKSESHSRVQGVFNNFQQNHEQRKNQR